MKGTVEGLDAESRSLVSEYVRRICDNGGSVELHGTGHANYILDAHRFATLAAERAGLPGVVHHSGGYDGSDMLFILESGNDRYSIRTYWPETSPDRIRSKYLWMGSLSADGIRGPEPLSLVGNDYLFDREEIESRNESDPQARYCVIRSWLEGIPLSELPAQPNRTDLVSKLGQLMGRLVSSAKSFRAPTWFDRPRFDGAHYLGFVEDNTDTAGHLSEDLMRLMGDSTEDTQTFGLIHTEAGPQNILLNTNELCVIDFNRCGWGYYAASIAKTMRLNLSESEFPVFASGYEEIVPLPPKVPEWTKTLGQLMQTTGRMP